MKDCTDNLWSPEIRPEILSPRDILEMQAVALREQSGGLLSAEVREVHDKAEGSIYLILDMIAPTLNEDRHRILTARSFADRTYPCFIDAEGLRSAEGAHSEHEFRELVRQVLHSGEVKSLALSLIARARDGVPAPVQPRVRHHSGHRRLFRPSWIGVETDNEFVCAVDALYDESHGID